MSCRVGGVAVGGLALADLRIDAYRVGLAAGWPPRLRAERVRVRATVEQSALDDWLRADALPVRIRLGERGIAIRAGIGGLRLAELRAAVEIENGRLVVTPQGTELLGLGVGSPPLRVPLPVPPLPRRTTVSAVAVSEGRATVTLEIPDVDEALEPGTWRRAGRMVALT